MAALTVRRADFLMALAYATDLATGHSRDFALRSCVPAMRLADISGLDEPTHRTVYHQALLRYIGCNADTHLLAAAFGDEIALRRDLQRIDIVVLLRGWRATNGSAEGFSRNGCFCWLAPGIGIDPEPVNWLPLAASQLPTDLHWS